VQSRSACDKYKLSIDLSFQDPKVLMRTNVDWSGPSLAHGKKVYDELLKQKWAAPSFWLSFPSRSLSRSR
jgi:hypothetical protein